jgi:hypothetical protein
VLLCTCLIARIVGDRGRIGVLVEAMLEVVGPDVMARGWWRDDEPLIGDRRMQDAAAALNRMDRPLREVLILTWLGGRTPREVARLLGRSVGEIEMDLSRAEEALAAELGCGLSEAWERLHEFTAKLDLKWILEVGCCAMEYLMAEFEQTNELATCRMN